MANEKITYSIDIKGNATTEIDKIDKALKKINDTASKVQPQNSLKKELREIQIEMANLDASGQGGSKRFLELAQRGGQIKDSMSAAADQIKTFAFGTSLEKNINLAKNSFELFNGTAQVATSTMAIFGIENDNVAKSIQTMVALQTLGNGVSTIYNKLTKEGAIVTALMSAKTKAAGAMQLFYSTAIGSSTGALKVFKLALAGTGIGAAVIAIGYLVEKMMSLSSETEEVNGELEYLNSFKLKDIYKDAIKSVEEYKNKIIEAEIELLKSQGKTKEANAKQAELDKSKQEKIYGDLYANIATLRAKEQKEIDAYYKKNEAIAPRRLIKKFRTINGKEYGLTEDKLQGLAKITEDTNKSIAALTQDSVFKDTFETIINKTRNTKDNKEQAKQLEKENRLVNQAPKTFNVYVSELGSVKGPVTIANLKDEKEFQQMLTNTLLGAITTIQVQTM